MNKKLSVKTLAALVVFSALGSRTFAQNAPTCADWLGGDRKAETCSCGGETRKGDARFAACATTADVAPAQERREENSAGPSPAQKIAAMAVPNADFDGGKFGIKSVTVRSGYISGADGSGFKNGSASVEIYRQKTKAGTLSGEVEIGSYKMGGIGFTNTQNVGVVGQLPNGAPINGTVYSQGVSPAATYIPMAAFKYAPPIRVGRLHPYAVAEVGMTRLSSTNAQVGSTLVSSIGGQPVGSQNLGTSAQPTGEGLNHPGGGFGGGADFDVTRHVALNAQYLDAPTGYKVVTYGVKYNIHAKKD